MNRCDFNRTPFASQSYELGEIIPSIPYTPLTDPNSPDQEVRFDDARDQQRSIFYDWHEHNQELEIVCGYNSIRREVLNDALREMRNLGRIVKLLSVTMATPNARAHALLMSQNGLQRSQDRSRTTWTYTADLEELAARKKERKSRVKPEPKPVDNRTGLERIRDQYLADGLIVPQRLTDELKAEADLREKTAQIEKAREAVKASPLYLELQAKIERLKAQEQP